MFVSHEPAKRIERSVELWMGIMTVHVPVLSVMVLAVLIAEQAPNVDGVAADEPVVSATAVTEGAAGTAKDAARCGRGQESRRWSWLWWSDDAVLSSRVVKNFVVFPPGPSQRRTLRNLRS
jgi:hypothetical protein